MVSLNFSRADLVEIIHIIAQHLRLTYTIDPEVKGTVTIHSAEPLRPEDLLPIFHQILRMNGAVAVRTGNLYHITLIKDGKSLARPAGQSREDSFAIQIVPVRFFSVAEMKKLLTPFLQPGGEIIDYPRGNFLIIVDLPSNIQRLTEIADLVDVQVFAGTRMEIYQPKVASAEELAAEMTKIMQSYSSSVPQSDSFTAQFIALPRINQLLVISYSEAAWTYARRWLERIDVVAEGPGRRIFIYPVENGKATELADVLNQALGQPSAGRREAPRTLQDLHRSTPGGTTGQPGGTRSTTPQFGSPGSTTQQSQPLGGFATIPVPGQPAAPVAPTPAPTAPGVARPPTPAAPGAKPEEQLRIVADPATNSLIIFGTAQEFQNIRNILKELDVVPRQVLLDVLIAEVTLSDNESFGVDYEILRKGGDVRIFDRQFGSRSGVLTGLLGGLAAANAAGVSQFPNGISGVIGTGDLVRAFINALMTDSRVKILSSPSILATDNRPARIQVGSEEPIATGTITGAVGTVASSTTIQYRNTGRIVTIIPQVNSQGLVNLQILTEVSQRGGLVQVGPDRFPSFDLRQAETSAVVQDGDTLAIGGIIAENKERDRTGIPYLMDLPVLGRFFGMTSDILKRTELIMLITPHVIRTRDESRQVTEDFKNSLSTVRNELERMRSDREREEQRRESLRQEQQRRLEEQEKLQRQKQEQEKPAAPPPASKVPNPSSSSSPGGPAPLSGPAREISVPKGPPSSMAPSYHGTIPERNESDGAVVGDTIQKTQVEPEKFETFAVPNETTSSLPVTNRQSLPTIGDTASKIPLQKKPTPVWVVQVASFDQQKDAESMVYKLMKKGYYSRITAVHVNEKTWYRVRVGPFASRGEASEFQKKLATTEKIAQTLVLNR